MYVFCFVVLFHSSAHTIVNTHTHTPEIERGEYLYCAIGRSPKSFSLFQAGQVTVTYSQVATDTTGGVDSLGSPKVNMYDTVGLK